MYTNIYIYRFNGIIFVFLQAKVYSMTEILSFNQFREAINGKKKAYLLLWKKGAGQSECAFRNLDIAAREHKEVSVFSADVSTVRDIHPVYGIATAPALLEFVNGELVNVIKGCHDANYYEALLLEAVFAAMPADDSKPVKQVIVYTTPTCSWCNALKAWLRKNRVPFREIDVSRDERMAQELVRKSGQMGVPQTEINGQIVVGFNQPRLRELLEINN